MDFSGNSAAANVFRKALAGILDELVGQTDHWDGLALVKEALPRISLCYKKGLRYACTDVRTDWTEPANRCAYVFIYLVHHSYVVYCSLRHSALRAVWHAGLRHGGTLSVCSIGGGPGSDLLGLAQFLDDHDVWPSGRLNCLVLDLYPEWRETWEAIYDRLPRQFGVTYGKCNFVEDRHLPFTYRNFVRQADLLTLIKSFSAVSAFFRDDHQSGSLLRTILGDLKAGGFVLYVDNLCSGDDQFQREFALPAGLKLVEEFRGEVELPFGSIPDKVRQYTNDCDYNPMRKCDLLVQLFQKKPSHAQRAVNPQPSPYSSVLTNPAVRQYLYPQPEARTTRQAAAPSGESRARSQSGGSQPNRPNPPRAPPPRERNEESWCTIL